MLERFWALAFAFALLTSPALAHDANGNVVRDSGEAGLGVPGKAGDVDRTIAVQMVETAEGRMAFDPAVIEVEAGETVRLSLTNQGQAEHEFVLDTPGELAEHAAMMREMPDMEHAEPNAIRLKPGASGEILWKFGRASEIEFACLIPGHFEAGMHGRVLLRHM